MPTPPTPAGLAIEHATQSLTAPARTEPLLRHPRPHREEHIAARPLARLPGKIFRIRGWALALARLHRLQLRVSYGGRCRFPGHLLFDATQRLFPARRPLLSLSFPVAARLPPPTLLAHLTGPVGPRAPPATPPHGLLATAGAAIPLLRVMGVERPFTALEQTEPLPKPGTGFLRPTGRGPILNGAHGSSQLPGSSLEAERISPLRGVLIGTSTMVPSIPLGETSGQPTTTAHAVRLAARAATGRDCPVAARATSDRHNGLLGGRC